MKLSGLTKQDYITKRLLNKDIVVVGNPRVYKALRNQMQNIFTELKRIGSGEKIDSDLFEIIQLVNETLGGLKE